VAVFYGVNAERRSLEDIAKPLTAQDAEQADAPDERAGRFTRQEQCSPSASPASGS